MSEVGGYAGRDAALQELAECRQRFLDEV